MKLRDDPESGSSLIAAWRTNNRVTTFPTDLVHFLNYFVAHEAHHRGQLILLARQLGHRLPTSVTGGVWQWTRRARESSLPRLVLGQHLR